MNGLDFILLHMLDRMQGERSAAGCFYILKGKKSGQAIQDAAIFEYQNWYGSIPDLDRHVFDQYVQDMLLTDYILRKEQSYIPHPNALSSVKKRWEALRFVERSGLNEEGSISTERLVTFWRRLQLWIQVASHYLYQNARYQPIVSEPDIKYWVKQKWTSLDHKRESIADLKDELYTILRQMEQNDPFLPYLFIERMSGHTSPGKTFRQLEKDCTVPEALLRLYWLQAVRVCFYHAQGNPFLHSFTRADSEQAAAHPSSLTESATVTLKYLSRGLPIDQIAAKRRLKVSTIEDHIVEMAAKRADFSYAPFLAEQQVSEILRVSQTLNTKKLSMIKRELGNKATYLQIRLALLRGGK